MNVEVKYCDQMEEEKKFFKKVSTTLIRFKGDAHNRYEKQLEKS